MTGPTLPPPPAPRSRRAVTIGIGLALALALVALLWRTSTSPPDPLVTVRPLAQPIDLGTTLVTPNLAISSDGRQIAYPALGDPSGLYLRSLDQPSGAVIPGTKRGIYPTFSPDGEAIAFLRGSKIERIPLAGGRAVSLGQGGTSLMAGIDWGSDGYIYFSDLSTIRRVAETGGRGESLQLSELPTEPSRWVVGKNPDLNGADVSLLYPSVFADGKTLLFTEFSDETGEVENGAGQLWALSLVDGTRRLLASGHSQVLPTASGHLLSAAGGRISALLFDPETLSVDAESVPVVQGVLPFSRSFPGGHFAVSDDGTLVYLAPQFTALQNRLVWLDHDGHMEPLIEHVGQFSSPRFSPDGSRLGYLESRFDEWTLTTNVWVLDIESRTRSQLTWVRRASAPVWSPDGRSVLFTQLQSGRKRHSGIFTVPVEGGRRPERLSSEFFHVRDWSPDGRHLMLATNRRGVPGLDLAVLEIGRGDEPTPFLPDPGSHDQPKFSPDGRWVAFVERQGEKHFVYVAAFPEPKRSIRVSDDNGRCPRWSRDGRSIFYLNGNTVFRAPVDGAAEFHVGTPEVFAELSNLPANLVPDDLDVAPDGRLVILLADITLKEHGQVDIALGVFSDLERLTLKVIGD